MEPTNVQLRSDHGFEDEATETVLSQRTVRFRRFRRNRLAVAAVIVLAVLYLVMVAFPEFFSNHFYQTHHADYVYAPPQIPRFVDEEGTFHLRPFVYPITSELDMETFNWVYTTDTSQRNHIYFFTRGYSYDLLGLFPTDIHFFGLEDPEQPLFLFGTDRLGRDVFSRILFGGRVSLTVGLVGVFLTIIIGSFMGTMSGYFSGPIDNAVQRLAEVLMSFPSIPLWAALGAALPSGWTPLQNFFAISVILSLRNWTGLARELRGKVLSFRESEYTLAAKCVGASHLHIIVRHMIPNSMSHIIVISTLSIPFMILAETSLSFLGLGIQPPSTSWGVLLQAAQQVNVVLEQPWLLLPGIFVVIAVLSFNFLGDGIRDALDPYSS